MPKFSLSGTLYGRSHDEFSEKANQFNTHPSLRAASQKDLIFSRCGNGIVEEFIFLIELGHSLLITLHRITPEWSASCGILSDVSQL